MSLSVYARLLRVPSLGWLLGTSILGRLNQSMTGLALLLLITQHGSYALAGAVTMSYMVGCCIAGPLLTRLADDHGRRRVLRLSAVAFAAVLTALAYAPPRALVLHALALLAGAVTPPITAAVRAALPALVPDDRRTQVFALESTLQELIFVSGPPLTAAIAAVGGPRAAVVASGVFVLVGTLAFAGDRNAEAGRAARPASAGRGVLHIPGVVRLMVAGAAIVAAFSASALAVVAFISGPTATGEAGLSLAAASLGSLVGGLWFGVRLRHDSSLLAHLGAVAGAFLLLLLAPNPLVLTLLLFVWGTTVAPALTLVFQRMSTLPPAWARTTAFGWLGSAMTAGNGVGAAVGGVVVTHSPRAGFVLAAVLAFVAAGVAEPLRGRRTTNAPDEADGVDGADVGAPALASH